ncbi:MAG: hypothetical protein H0X51_07145 [Parachlamydiaceae bacterium]|nr:hypothetical protein [Parachlamydiaceae bacterium]
MTECSQIRDLSLPASAIALSSPLPFTYIEEQPKKLVRIILEDQYEYVALADRTIALYTGLIKKEDSTQFFNDEHHLVKFTILNSSSSAYVRLVTCVVLDAWTYGNIRDEGVPKELDEQALETHRIIPGLEKRVMEVPMLADMVKKRMAARRIVPIKDAVLLCSVPEKLTPHLEMAFGYFFDQPADKLCVLSELGILVSLSKEDFSSTRYQEIPIIGSIYQAIIGNIARHKMLCIHRVQVEADSSSYNGVFRLRSFKEESKAT